MHRGLFFFLFLLLKSFLKRAVAAAVLAGSGESVVFCTAVSAYIPRRG